MNTQRPEKERINLLWMTFLIGRGQQLEASERYIFQSSKSLKNYPKSSFNIVWSKTMFCFLAYHLSKAIYCICFAIFYFIYFRQRIFSTSIKHTRHKKCFLATAHNSGHIKIVNWVCVKNTSKSIMNENRRRNNKWIKNSKHSIRNHCRGKLKNNSTSGTSNVNADTRLWALIFLQCFLCFEAWKIYSRMKFDR